MMKPNVLILAFMLTGSIAVAQTIAPIQSFMGVKFGTPPDDAIQVMSVNKATYLATKSKKGNYVFRDGTYGRFKSDYVYFKYSNNTFFEGGAYFKADRDKTMKLYLDLKHAIASSFGEGTEGGTFSGEYRAGDGKEIDAIENGQGALVTRWIEDPANGKRNTIELSIEPDLVVLLKYTEEKASRKSK